jgi:hypothetical protein
MNEYKPIKPFEKPKIAAGFLYDKNDKFNQLKLVDFTPGMRLRRCGRLYEVDAKGQQRRVRE